MGDALLQKTYTVDFLTKKLVLNTGHAAQYYVEDSHEAIMLGKVSYWISLMGFVWEIS
ncbi:hypothetical protein [Desulfosporosinus orientis]|uniref:hypothetical protein n=1 Tax=Desulfosporosinus orientis TaxID=1563 RepID=UPI000313D287|nr:hypothetical protein [Desulfosporosinus orientis]